MEVKHFTVNSPIFDNKFLRNVRLGTFLMSLVTLYLSYKMIRLCVVRRRSRAIYRIEEKVSDHVPFPSSELTG